MTNVYFVRHAEADQQVKNDRSRPLTAKGLEDRALVAAYLDDKGVTLVVTSPYKRAFDTVAPFARGKGLGTVPVEDFKERRISSGWIDDFKEYSKRQWEDFDYSIEDGESLAHVQARNVGALMTLLKKYPGETIVIGGHGTAISTVINYFDKSFNYNSFTKIAGLMPWIVHFKFEGTELAAMETVDLFAIEL